MAIITPTLSLRAFPVFLAATLKRFRFVAAAEIAGVNGYLIAVAAIAAWMRFHQLDLHSLWDDELYSVGMVSLTASWASAFDIGKHPHFLRLSDGFWTWKLADQHPPLYEMVLAIWVRSFGTSDYAVRSLSAFFGVATVLTVHLLPKQLGSLVRVIYATLLATSGMLLIYSQEARGYMLGGLLASLMVTMYCRQLLHDREALDRGRPSWVLLMAAALLALTHYYGGLMVASFALIVTLSAGSLRASMHSVLRWTISMLPVILYLSLGWKGILTKLDASSTSVSYFIAFRRAAAGLIEAFVPNAGVIGFWLVTVCIAVVLVWMRLHRSLPKTTVQTAAKAAISYVGGVTLVFVALMAMATKKSEFFHPRYLIFAVPGMCLCLALVPSFTKGWRRYAATAMLFFLIPLGIQSWRSSPTSVNGRNWRSAAHFAADSWKRGDVIIAPFAPIRILFAHYLVRFIPSITVEEYLLSPNDAGELAAQFMDRPVRPNKAILFKDLSSPGLEKLSQSFESYLQDGGHCVSEQVGEFMTFRVTVLNCAMRSN